MELELQPAATALVVIDLQRGIVGMPSAPHSSTDVVARVAQVAKAMRAAGGTVVLVHVTPSPDGKDGLRPVTDAPAMGAGRSLPSTAIPNITVPISQLRTPPYSYSAQASDCPG